MSPQLNARFIDDLTIPDGSDLPSSTNFVKTWLVENIGDTPWGPGFTLRHVDGAAMTTLTRVPLPTCAPGERMAVSVELTAPQTPGFYQGDWRCHDADGLAFGDQLWVQIRAIRAPGTNDAIYLDDVTIPDDAQIPAEMRFAKTWRVRNTGTLPWGSGYTLRRLQGAPLAVDERSPLPPCPPGGETNVSVNVVAPAAPGKYYADWAMYDPADQRFGVTLWMRIVVPGAVVPNPKPRPDLDAATGIAPHFSQRDTLWRKNVLGGPGSPVTIGSWGCLLTCFAMLACAYDCDTDPARLNRTLLEKSGFFQNYFVSWNALQTAFDTLVFDAKSDASPDLLGHIDASLAARRPVPIQVDRTPATRYNDNDQHWVLAVARHGNDYIVNDPIDLDPVPTLLMERYGRGQDLAASVLAAIFYHRA
ncbi:NBR1-Ig-like domain-containing protein [Aggregatilinea lenta]|uniref:NBR1-Ig-like domain-containing protein n=1 Tax=Aggregatilinea lenta TaxID=913108 RepID=UPI000E5BFAFD|nr:NBR1-Ig-like domain-containing protein [Aggregatilinea lenta]